MLRDIIYVEASGLAAEIVVKENRVDLECVRCELDEKFCKETVGWVGFWGFLRILALKDINQASNQQTIMKISTTKLDASKIFVTALCLMQTVVRIFWSKLEMSQLFHMRITLIEALSIPQLPNFPHSRTLQSKST